MALALASNRHIHKGYIKVRENNFSLVGLTGLNFFKKTAGIIGTGKIGAAMCRICKGFGMRVIAYDIYQNPDLDFVEYVDLDTLLAESDLISLHCPLTDDSYHMINSESINKMKDNVVLVNTSRGALIDTEDLIKGIRQHKFHSVGLDVYEEERIRKPGRRYNGNIHYIKTSIIPKCNRNIPSGILNRRSLGGNQLYNT